MLLPPGNACAFYVAGVCFYPEAVNPGYDPAYRCRRLLRLTERWDDFIDRAEAFGLSEEMAGRIWNAREHGQLYSRKRCPAAWPLVSSEPPALLPPDEEGEALGCAHLWQGTCLLTLPRCEGVCMRYRVRK